MLIIKYKFQVVSFSLQIFQTFQVHPHRTVISHFPCHDSGVVDSYPVIGKTFRYHADNPVILFRTFAVAFRHAVHLVMVHLVGTRTDDFTPLLHGERDDHIVDRIFHLAQTGIDFAQQGVIDFPAVDSPYLRVAGIGIGGLFDDIEHPLHIERTVFLEHAASPSQFSATELQRSVRSSSL